MKLLFILAAAYGLVVCQATFRVFDPNDIYQYPRPQPPKYQPRPHIGDMIIEKIQEIIHNFVTGIQQLKKPLKDNGFSSMAAFLDMISNALERFSDSIEPAKVSAIISPFRAVTCQLYDTRPACKRDHDIN